MIKKLACFLIILNSLLLFTSPGSAVQGADFCAFEELEFEEYLAIIRVFAETEEYPHYFNENEDRYKDFQKRHPDMPFDVVIALVNVNNDLATYIDIETVTDPTEITVLLNKYFSLPPSWEPDGLIDIGFGYLMHPEAAEQLTKMREAMKEINLNLVVISTYRSYQRQIILYNEALETRTVERAERSYARAGHSEHQTGLALDILHMAYSDGPLHEMRFELSTQYSWLMENAHEYGFLLRYPRGHLPLSGFVFEPWHWRFVGAQVATAMYNEGIVLFEEFYGRYLVQGMRDKVNEYIQEQQRLAEEAAAAAVAAAAEAAAEEAAKAAELAAAEAAEAELARVEAIIKAAAQAAADEALEKAAAEAAELKALAAERSSAARYFIVLLVVIGVYAAASVLWVARAARKDRKMA